MGVAVDVALALAHSLTTASDLQRVFVVGFPRSGTTWLVHLLSQHPEVVGSHQAGLFHALRPLERWWRRSGVFGRDVVGGAQETSLTAALSPEPFGDAVRSLADRVFARIADCKPGARVVVEQTPENLEFHELVRQVYPEAWFIHLVRDPRAVYCSWRSALRSWATSNDFVDSPAFVARRWCEFDRAGRELSQLTDRYRELRYEDLVGQPVEKLGELLSWLGLQSAESFCEKAVDACSIDRMRATVRAPKGFFRNGTAEGWRGEIATSARRTIEYVAQGPMTRLGYLAEAPARRKPMRLWVYERAAGVAKRLRFAVSDRLRLRLRAMTEN